MVRVSQLFRIILPFAYVSILSRFLRVWLLLRYVCLIYAFSRGVSFLLLIAVFSVLIIQFRFRIAYPFAKVSQINGLRNENRLNTAPLTFVYFMHVIEEKKVLALLIRQVEWTCTSSLLALSRSVDDVRRLRLSGR